LGLVGLVVGSFCGLVSLRLPQGRPVILGRSACDGCKRTLQPWRLVPLLSFALSRGRCASCGDPIPVRYPLLEAGCAALGVLSGWLQPSPADAVLTAVLLWTLLLIALVDAEHFWLPDSLTLPLGAFGFLAATLLERTTLRDSLIGAVAGFASLWLLARLYRALRDRDGLGGGDPILFAACGAWVGWQGLPSVLLWACAAGLALVLTLLLFRREVSGATRLPFGVFLAVGAALTWCAGPLGLR
jgi:leader peptidase (prepilin peptidase) / N-methyltransferase